MRAWLCLAALAVTLTGCGTAATPPTAAVGTPTASPPPIVAVITAKGTTPTGIQIPRIGASSTLNRTVGVDGNDVIEVPPVAQPMQAAWYRYSPVPGATGPAVILGHINGGGHPGVFARLGEVVKGDQVLVTRSDGKRLTFTVTATELADKALFPSDAVYGDTTGPTLRLLSCGGRLDKIHHRYLDQVIVYADLAAVRTTP